MDRWKFFAITHAQHRILNPLSEVKVDEIVSLLNLTADAHLYDAGCGKGEFLVRAALRWGCRGLGVDASPYFVADARNRVAASNLQDRIQIIESKAEDFPVEPASYDAAACFGATWIWGGYKGTLNALRSFTKPNGLVVVGEPFWKRPPSEAYLNATNIPPATYGTHIENMQAGHALGLTFLHSVVSSDDDWDRYEGYQWYSTELYARQNPDDANVPEVLRREHEGRDAYWKWGRDEMGWAVYMFLR